MPQPAHNALDVDRAVTTIEMVLSGGKLANPADLMQALAVVGRTTDAIFDELLRLNRPDVAWSFLIQLTRKLPVPDRPVMPDASVTDSSDTA